MKNLIQRAKDAAGAILPRPLPDSVDATRRNALKFIGAAPAATALNAPALLTETVSTAVDAFAKANSGMPELNMKLVASYLAPKMGGIKEALRYAGKIAAIGPLTTATILDPATTANTETLSRFLEGFLYGELPHTKLGHLLSTDILEQAYKQAYPDEEELPPRAFWEKHTADLENLLRLLLGEAFDPAMPVREVQQIVFDRSADMIPHWIDRIMADESLPVERVPDILQNSVKRIIGTNINEKYAPLGPRYRQINAPFENAWKKASAAKSELDLVRDAEEAAARVRERQLMRRTRITPVAKPRISKTPYRFASCEITRFALLATDEPQSIWHLKLPATRRPTVAQIFTLAQNLCATAGGDAAPLAAADLTIHGLGQGFALISTRSEKLQKIFIDNENKRVPVPAASVSRPMPAP